MDVPRLPPVVAGRSALPAFLEVEAWARRRVAVAHEAADALLREARAEAERVRSAGEAAVREAVVQGERDALRDVESRARDRVSAARRGVAAWVEAAEEASVRAVDEALDRICGGA
jgi:hypothetical protein